MSTKPVQRVPHVSLRQTEQPMKHVIAEYRHNEQTVTCVCGWTGSTATTPGNGSEWTAHVAQNRAKRPAR